MYRLKNDNRTTLLLIAYNISVDTEDKYNVDNTHTGYIIDQIVINGLAFFFLKFKKEMARVLRLYIHKI